VQKILLFILVLFLEFFHNGKYFVLFIAAGSFPLFFTHYNNPGNDEYFLQPVPLLFALEIIKCWSKMGIEMTGHLFGEIIVILTSREA
jgi:hypothetical protein